MNPIVISFVSFVISFVFALCGLGSALALIPTLVFLGVSYTYARSTGLFVNLVTTLSITVHNIRARKVKSKIALPIIVFSVLSSPLGAYTSVLIPQKVVGLSFLCFLVFSVVITLFPIKKIGKSENIPIYVLGFIGLLAGFISGLLGVGGGAIISPLLLIAGMSPKVVITVTPLSVVFSSLTSFISYAKLGGVDWIITTYASIPAVFAGYLAGRIAHKLKAKTIRKVLALVLLIMAIKFGLKIIS